MSTWTRLVAPLVLVGITLAGCADPAQILMRNPRTDQVMTCFHSPFTMSATECADKLERDGWVRVH